MLYQVPTLEDIDYQVLAAVDGLREKLRYQVREPRRWTGLLRRVALARAIRGSNSIEGFHVDVNDAFAAVGEEEPMTADHAAWSAVKGYRDAMTYVLQLANEEDFEYSDALIKSLHFMMQHYDLTKWPGRYRKGPIYVYDEDQDMQVYEGPGPDTVPALMRELVVAVNKQTKTPAIVRAAMAHLNLVMIHPFKDGNGRMARCLQALVLAREGVLAPEFCSIEENLARNEPAYYKVLADVGKGSWHPEHDAIRWIRFCLTAHYRQALTVLRRTQQAEMLWGVAEREIHSTGLNERCTGPFFHALSGYRLRNQTYREIEDVSVNLASRDLADLVAAGLLEAFGAKKGRHYEPVERLKEESVEVRAKVRREHPLDADPYEALAEGGRLEGATEVFEPRLF